LRGYGKPYPYNRGEGAADFREQFVVGGLMISNRSHRKSLSAFFATS
jgi:hypothetical protein